MRENTGCLPNSTSYPAVSVAAVDAGIVHMDLKRDGRNNRLGLNLQQTMSMLRVLAKGTNYLFGRLLRKKNIFIGSSLAYLKRERVIDRNYFDYVRLATLELVSYEMNRQKLVGK